MAWKELRVVNEPLAMLFLLIALLVGSQTGAMQYETKARE